MKKLLVIAVALASVNAFATRARVAALNNAPHLVDTVTVYDNPSYMFQLGDFVTLETGATAGVAANAQNANAEGQIVRTMGDAKMGLSLGHQSMNASSWGLRGLAATASLAASNQQNPVEFSYGAKSGDMAWGATLVYSNYNNKTAAGATLAKESSMGLRFGATQPNMDYFVGLGAANTAETASGIKFTGTMGVSGHFGYQMDTIYLTGDVVSAGFKEDNAGVDLKKYSYTSISVGAMTSMKKDGGEFFYGANLLSTTQSETVADTKTDTLGMPIYIGVETEAASWLTLRGSVRQTLQLVHNTKTTTAGTTTAELAPAAGDTTVALGAGLKFNKVSVDGTLTTATTQVVNTTTLLAQVGMTYNF